MNLFDLLKGKKMSVMTDMKVEVELIIEKVEEHNHSEDLEKPSAANDWYPNSRNWKTYMVHFTNGATKKFNHLDEIKFFE